MDFFITGLPRSRTAWLANFFTTGESFCAHDAVMGCESLAAYAARLNALPGRFRGDSDSALALFAPTVMAWYPEARWIVVRRDESRVVRSLGAMGDYAGLRKPTEDEAAALLRIASRRLDDLAKHPRVRVVEFDALDSLTTLYSLWEWCLGSRVPWCPERAAMLQAMRVTVIENRVLGGEATADLMREVA